MDIFSFKFWFVLNLILSAITTVLLFIDFDPVLILVLTINILSCSITYVGMKR